MILKKFYGTSIKKARKKAFDKLGSDCIVLESWEASDDQNAGVTVMLDKKREDLLENPAEKHNKPTNSDTYSRKDMIPNSLEGVKEAIAEGFDQFSSQSRSENSSESTEQVKRNKQQTNESLTMSRRSTQVYNNEDASKDRSSSFEKKFSENLQEKTVSKEVKALHRRFDHMENLLSDALISANMQYVSHPAFQQLMNAGMQPTTVSKWFEKVLNKGIDPYEQNQSFMYELANIARAALSFALPEAPQKNMLFVGPSGSGKTSLIMKMATHPDFMLNSNVALVSIEPKSNFKHYSKLKLFASDVELPYYTIQDGVELGSLLPELEEFDYVLFDSPSISLQQQAAFRDFWKIRQMLSSVKPLEVHYTVDATLERYYFKESYATNHPLQPDYVAITHLDETDNWGHLIPFINGLGANVRYVSQGPNVPDNINTFKPEWFAEKILSES